MSLAAGTELGRYKIRSQIGAGGMGEVYLAHDTKLNRNVAIKVLPAALSQDAREPARHESQNQSGRCDGHRELHVARAGDGTRGGSSNRHLQSWRGAL